MKKYLFFILLLVFIITPLIAFAAEWKWGDPLVICGTSKTSDCTLCDIFRLAQIIVKFITTGLFIIAPIFIVIGGIRILVGGAKPDEVQAGKKMITNAIIGIVIALAAWIVINMIFIELAKAPGDEGIPWPWHEIDCKGGGIVPGPEEAKNICTCGENKLIGSKEYSSGKECLSQCSNYCKKNFSGYIGGDYGCCEVKIMENGCFASSPTGQWCQRPVPSGSENWRLSGINPNQKGDAANSLVNFLNCMYAPENGLRNTLTITSISSDILCNNPSCDTSKTGCGHTANSCHFGGTNTNCKGASHAVDFSTSVACKDIERVARFCAGSNAWINWENNHTHVSLDKGTCGCNEAETGNPCPN